MYDYILKGATVIDPTNNIHSIFDLAIENGMIAEIEPDISIRKSRRFINLSGNVLIPGIIDSHVHLNNEAGGPEAFRMLAASGVVTAVDFAGPLEDITGNISRAGCGLNIAVLEALLPGNNIRDNRPGKNELKEITDQCAKNGALGIKILGGHFPLTPESTALAIEIANGMGVYTAFHAGTTINSGDFSGFREAVALIDGKRAHLAHINSYCRGDSGTPAEEAREALAILSDNMNIISESYLSLINGTSGYCENNAPVSRVTRKHLDRGGFISDKKGLGKAIKAGYARVNAPRGGVNILLGGSEGVDAWEKAGTGLFVSFEVNDPNVLRLCATAKNEEGRFIVNAISTDGGGIARNVQIEKGLLLVKLGLLSLEEFVLKTSWNPSRMFGMINKGHLGPGADADITVLDFEAQKAVLTMGRGNIIFLKDFILGSGGTLLITEKGRKRIDALGINRQIIDVTSGLMYTRENTQESRE